MLRARIGTSSHHREGTVGESFAVRMAAAVARSRFGRRHGILRTMQDKFDVLLTAVHIRTGIVMSSFKFTLILSGVAEITSNLADALYAATDGDIEFNMRNGVAYVEFDQQAKSLQEAVKSAIKQVEQAGVGVRVVRVESDVANTIAKINAALLGVGSAEAVG